MFYKQISFDLLVLWKSIIFQMKTTSQQNLQIMQIILNKGNCSTEFTFHVTRNLLNYFFNKKQLSEWNVFG